MALVDVQLATKIVNGDEEAFSAFYRKYRGDIQYHVASIIKDEFEAEDLTQEVFLRAYRAMSTYTGDASLRRWLRKIATNICIDKMRKKRVPEVSWPTVKDKDGNEELLELSDKAPSCLERLQMKESHETALRVISYLPSYYRDVVVLHDLMNYSREEIAQKLNCPLGTVKSRLSRAHATLARFMGNKGATEGDRFGKSPAPSNGKPSMGNILCQEMVAV